MSYKVNYKGATQHTRVLTAKDQQELGVPQDQTVDFVLGPDTNHSGVFETLPEGLLSFLKENKSEFGVKEIESDVQVAEKTEDEPEQVATLDDADDAPSAGDVSASAEPGTSSSTAGISTDIPSATASTAKARSTRTR